MNDFELKCEACGRDIQMDGIRALYRVGDRKQQPVRWKCENCTTPQERQLVDDQLAEVKRMIEES